MQKRTRYGGVITGFVERFMPSERCSDREEPVRYTSFKKGTRRKTRKTK